MDGKQILLSPPELTGNEITLIKEVLDSNNIAPGGEMSERFESEFCEYTHYPYAIATNSGTAALHLALRAIGVRKDDLVWGSTLTYIASVEPVLYCGGRLAFIDSSWEDWNIDVNLLEERLKIASKKNHLPKALVITDLYGQPCDYDELYRVCEYYNVQLIADATESLGAKYKGRLNSANISAYSFNGNKIITTSGGGMLAAKDKSLIDYARYLAHQARDPTPYCLHKTYGYNYRMSNVLAALGVAQLQDIERRVKKRKENYYFYCSAFKDIAEIRLMPVAKNREPNFWISVILIDPNSKITNEMIRVELEKHNIEARQVWRPMHTQPVFSKYKAYGGSVSEKIFLQGLCLPSGSSLSKEDLEKISSIIIDLFKNFKRK